MRLLAAFLLVAATALAGCTGGGGDDFVTPEMDDQGRYIIEMLPSNQFSPKFAKVPAGATVVWMNVGGGHNTVSEEGLWSSTTSSETGEHFEHTFADAGEYGYYCLPHHGLGMAGTILVE